MELDNIWVIDKAMISETTLERIRNSGLVGQKVWFANIQDEEVAFSTFNQEDGTSTQIQVVPAKSGRMVISRKSVFLDYLTPQELGQLRGGRNMLTIPFSNQEPIIAGAPAEKEVYFIDRDTMRVQIIIY